MCGKHARGKGICSRFTHAPSEGIWPPAHCQVTQTQRSEGGDQAFPGPWPRPVPHLQGQGIPLGRLAHEALFFALLEFPEVLLDQESSIKLANRDLII